MKSKLPENAKLTFKGEIWEVYQWPQKMFDGTTATFEGLKHRKNGVKIIAIHQGKIIMTKEKRPGEQKTYYTMPGGGIEENELPLDAAKRELLEETGVRSDTWEELYAFDVLNYPRIDFYTYLYVARNCTKVSEPKLDGGEEIAIEEVDFDTFVKNLYSNKERFGMAFSQIIENTEKINALKNKLEL